MKKNIAKSFLAVFCLFVVMAIPAINSSPAEAQISSGSTDWVKSIQGKDVGKSGWVQGIQRPDVPGAEQAPSGFDASVNALTEPIASALGAFVFFKVTMFGADVPLVVLWLVIGGVFFTIYTRFIGIRAFKHAIELVRGDFSDPNSHGEVSHFQALATAVSGTVGIGNIGGVAVAVTVGGPGLRSG